MLTLIGGFLFFIVIITVVVCLPIMIVIGKAIFALKSGARHTNVQNDSQQSRFRRESRPAQSHDIIDTTCTVISEEAV